MTVRTGPARTDLIVVNPSDSIEGGHLPDVLGQHLRCRPLELVSHGDDLQAGPQGSLDLLEQATPGPTPPRDTGVQSAGGQDQHEVLGILDEDILADLF